MDMQEVATSLKLQAARNLTFTASSFPGFKKPG